MDKNCGDKDNLKILNNDKNSYDNIIIDATINYILDEKSFEENKKTYDIYEGNYFSDIFGEYFKDYVKNINPKKSLIYSYNVNSRKFSNYTEYNKYDINFNFITGPDKIGKTFYALCNNKKENIFHIFHIYFNLKTFYELEIINNYEKSKKIFFYEISKFFKTYEDYKTFSEEFFKENINIFTSSYKFQEIFLIFLESIEKYMKIKNDIYPELMITLDEVELNEESNEIFNTNYNFINKLYKKIGSGDSAIHFSILSPINDNYIQRCIYLGLELFCKRATETYEIIEKDKNTGTIYYAYTYIPSLFYSNEEEFEEYKSKVRERNINKIPDKYLFSLNYSFYHLFNLETIYNNGVDYNTIIKEIENYIKKIKEEGNKIALSYYEGKNKIYKIDFEKLNKYNNIIGTEIDLDELMNLLLFFPVRLIKFQYKVYYDSFKGVWKKFLVTYNYPIYKNIVSTYLNLYNKKYKPGQKGDILEEKVIDTIKSGYFNDFTPDHFIEVSSIINLAKSNNVKDKEKFVNLQKYKLIMITQSSAYAQKYDMAFLQKIDNKNYQFILSQISPKKQKTKMEKYLTTKYDCYDFTDFFKDVNIEVNQYHFIIIFQAGLEEEEDKESMKFCQDNRIKYLKFCVIDRKPVFFN